MATTTGRLTRNKDPVAVARKPTQEGRLSVFLNQTHTQYPAAKAAKPPKKLGPTSTQNLVNAGN